LFFFFFFKELCIAKTGAERMRLALTLKVNQN